MDTKLWLIAEVGASLALLSAGCSSSGGGYSTYQTTSPAPTYMPRSPNQGDTVPFTPELELSPAPLGTLNINRYDPDSLANPYGAGNPYEADGLMNPYSEYGSPYSNKSWRNPYATDAPKLYDTQGSYRGRLSTNPYDPDSTANPFGRYGSPFSPESINNPYGAGNPYSTTPIYVVPSK